MPITNKGNGWGRSFGASLVGAIVVIILGFTGIFNRLITKFVPPIVGGTIIFVVGLSLMPVALSDNIYHAKGELGQNILLAFIAAGVDLLCALRFCFEKGRIFRVSSVIWHYYLGASRHNY